MVGDEQPDESLGESERGCPELEGGDARGEQARGGGGDDEHRADQQGADGVDRRDRREGDDGEQDDVGRPGAEAERADAEVVEPGGDPGAAVGGDGEQRRDQRAGGDEHLGPADREQRAEQKAIDAGAGREDVADARTIPTPGRRRGAGRWPRPHARPARRPRRSSRAAKPPPDREGRHRRRDPGGAGDDEAGEGRGADAVGEEGELAEHDLCAEQPRDRREQRDLEGGALHERELERIKHENHYLYRHGPEHGDPDPAGGATGSSTPRPRLRAAGHRASAPRSAVLELIGNQECVLSAREIADELRGGGREVGVATVYRTLELLEGMQLVQRLDVGGGSARYEPALPGRRAPSPPPRLRPLWTGHAVRGSEARARDRGPRSPARLRGRRSRSDPAWANARSALSR